MGKISSEQQASATETVVLSFLNALNNEDFNAAANYLESDVQFIGVLGTRDGASAYMNDMKKLKIKYDIQRSFTNGDEVCILCNFVMNGISVFGGGWYKLANHKISYIRVVFDPRPLLDK